MKILRFLGNLILGINQMADEKADDLSARLAHHGDYANYDDDNILGIFGGFLLFLTWVISIPGFLLLIGTYISYTTYFSFGAVIPGFEYISRMSILNRSITTVTAPFSIPIALFLFHYVRHAGWRLNN
ncbi:MAG: hypothetical protein KBB54_00105 [Candidatus Pacebacteria bacterium]|nr:hypothetical protein [Candidatus Paceibacterota bacterium]MBP9818631.1 hypothetical protein [Candidatus Paceibacterota bacterium]